MVDDEWRCFMKHTIIIMAAAILSVGLIGCASEQYTQNDRYRSMPADTTRMMKISDVVALSKAGASDSLIVATMDATNSWFKLTPQEVINLKKEGVSDKVITAMMEQPKQAVSQTNNSKKVVREYYMYPSDWWWWNDWNDPFWSYPYYPYYPSVSLGFGGHGFYPHGGFHEFHGGDHDFHGGGHGSHEGGRR
jgi:hypothetical protein